MPTGVQLTELISDLRHECGHSATVAHGVNSRDQLAYILKRTQRLLADEHDWPALVAYRNVSLLDGVRYYAYPSGLNFERIGDVWVKETTVWTRLCYGIGPEHLSEYDSDDGFKTWPPRRWQHDTDTGQLEVWPVPDQAGTLRLRGQRALGAFVADSDTCTLDSTLIVLTAAAEILGRQKNEDAPLKLQMAQRLLVRLLARQRSDKTEPFVIGGDGDGHHTRPLRLGLDYIPSGYGKG